LLSADKAFVVLQPYVTQITAVRKNRFFIRIRISAKDKKTAFRKAAIKDFYWMRLFNKKATPK
jgi:hypothetical protein